MGHAVSAESTLQEDPGLVDVSVDNGNLTISAHRTARSEESVQWLANERFFGTYRRQLSLGEDIEAANDHTEHSTAAMATAAPMYKP